MTKQNLEQLGPWKASITVHSDRRNLFELNQNHEFHIGTIVSGSKSEIPRFNFYVSLIEKAPQMRNLLLQIFEEITADEKVGTLDLTKLAVEISDCLNE